MNYSTVLCAPLSSPYVGQSLPVDGSIRPRHNCEDQNYYLRRCVYINLREKEGPSRHVKLCTEIIFVSLHICV